MDGITPIEEFIKSLMDRKLKAKLIRDLDLLGTYGNQLVYPISRAIKDERGSLFELRTKQGTNIVRVFYFFDKGYKIILLNGFIKKSDKTPNSELTLAYGLKKEYEERK